MTKQRTHILWSLLCWSGYGASLISGFIGEPSSSLVVDWKRCPRPLYSTRSQGMRSLPAKPRNGYSDERWEPKQEIQGLQPTTSSSTDRPTETLLGVDPPGISPSSPKIVVLGATGRVGRLVVRQLLEMDSSTVEDMTVVAFVRDYDKAIRVLYDDIVYAKANYKRRGPKLQIMEGNLVPPEELPGFEPEESDDEKEWRKSAGSAAKYFGNKVQDYDNRELLPDINESLEEALKGCTVVISCLGAIRPTNLWTDLLERPFWRILRADVSRWCEDGRHPYYVHFMSTRKALRYVEREQIRRETAAAALAEDENDSSPISVPKIRFIRISDLSVGQKPWHLVPLITNVVQSVIFRYHEMADQLLEASSRVETIVLRPGDLVDDERDVNTTSLQVSHTGYVSCPARISREDVASLAVAAALFPTPRYMNDMGDSSTKTTNHEAFHYTLACRWVGQQLDPFPPQGVKADGSKDATTALRRTLSIIEKNERRKRTLERTRKQTNAYLGDLKTAAGHSAAAGTRRKRQPYGLCVAIPVYVTLGLFARALVHPLVGILPGGRTLLLQLNQWFLLGISLIMGKLAMVLPFLAGGRKKYIPF